MSCCGGNCGCGSSCKCGNGCNGCNMFPDLGENSRTETIIAGVAPVKMSSERSATSFGAENDCKCGPNCTCDNCGCK